MCPCSWESRTYLLHVQHPSSKRRPGHVEGNILLSQNSNAAVLKLGTNKIHFHSKSISICAKRNKESDVLLMWANGYFCPVVPTQISHAVSAQVFSFLLFLICLFFFSLMTSEDFFYLRKQHTHHFLKNIQQWDFAPLI